MGDEALVRQSDVSASVMQMTCPSKYAVDLTGMDSRGNKVVGSVRLPRRIQLAHICWNHSHGPRTCSVLSCRITHSQGGSKIDRKRLAVAWYV